MIVADGPAAEDSSITGRAYRTIRDRIIRCELVPGSRLNITWLQAQFSLSQAAVREALSRLTAEGLVEIERNRGFRVAPVSIGGFRELARACIAVEVQCLASAIQNGDLEWELRVVSAYHRSFRTLEQVIAGHKDVDAFSTERMAFYEIMLEPCDNKWLLWAWRLLYAQFIRYRHVYRSLAKFESEMNAKHQEGLDVILRRDAALATTSALQNCELMIDFIEREMAAGNIAPQPEQAGATLDEPEVAA